MASLSVTFRGLGIRLNRAARGAPARLRFRESRAPVDQRQRPGAPPALLVRRCLVHVERGGIEHDAVVLEGAAHGDEAPRDILADALGITGHGIAPAPAAAGLEANDVTPLEHEAVAERGQLALRGRSRIEEDASRTPGMAARHAPGRDEEVLHARGQLRPIAEDAHVADHAGAAPMKAGPRRVGADSIALHSQREVALHVLDRVVLLGDVVDDVHAVGERARAEPDAEPFDAEDRPPARLVPGAEVVEDVHRRSRGHAAAVGLGERAEDAGHDAKARVGAHAERRREPGLQHAALAGHPFVEVAEQPFVDVQLRVERLQIAAEGDPQQPGIGHVVDRARAPGRPTATRRAARDRASRRSVRSIR